MSARAGLREQWLAAAVVKFRGYFSGHGYEIPEKVAVSCGWPSVGGVAKVKRRIGEAWASTSSRDKHFEIFISPSLDKGERVLDVLVHELVHVTVGLAAGHKGAFAVCARTIGLEGKMTATVAGAELQQRLKAMSGKLGEYPHGSLDRMVSGRKVQKGRLIKVYCAGCGYTLRSAMSWLLIAVPKCPNADCDFEGEVMTVDLPDEDGEPAGK